MSLGQCGVGLSHGRLVSSTRHSNFMSNGVRMMLCRAVRGSVQPTDPNMNSVNISEWVFNRKFGNTTPEPLFLGFAVIILSCTNVYVCAHVHMRADVLGGQWSKISLKSKLKLCKVGARNRTQTLYKSRTHY